MSKQTKPFFYVSHLTDEMLKNYRDFHDEMKDRDAAAVVRQLICFATEGRRAFRELSELQALSESRQ